MAQLAVALLLSHVLLHTVLCTVELSPAEMDRIMQEDGFDVRSLSTPSTPRPEDVNCWISVPSTRRLGGVCVQLENADNTHVYGCRSGVHLKLTQDCVPATPSLPRRGRNRRRGNTSGGRSWHRGN